MTRRRDECQWRGRLIRGLPSVARPEQRGAGKVLRAVAAGEAAAHADVPGLERSRQLWHDEEEETEEREDGRRSQHEEVSSDGTVWSSRSQWLQSLMQAKEEVRPVPGGRGPGRGPRRGRQRFGGRRLQRRECLDERLSDPHHGPGALLPLLRLPHPLPGAVPLLPHGAPLPPHALPGLPGLAPHPRGGALQGRVPPPFPRGPAPRSPPGARRHQPQGHQQPPEREPADGGPVRQEPHHGQRDLTSAPPRPPTTQLHTSVSPQGRAHPPRGISPSVHTPCNYIW
ncbi:UNVERIFIED_CONTAM: hypothetical protein GTU68_064093 [Idotea baltica]|nr:hypothetical protein [Idotea baltica]